MGKQEEGTEGRGWFPGTFTRDEFHSTLGGEGREKLFPWDEEKKGGGEGSCVEARGCACRAI